MKSNLATIAIVPRERFSFTKRALEHLLANTPKPFELIYVDGGSPPEVKHYLERMAACHGFRLIRRDEYLSPNTARNLAASQVSTKYVVFLDNDALVSPGWLESLVDCAESTGAWVAGPIYCELEPIATRIHMTGGTAHFSVENGKRYFHEEHRNYGCSLPELRPHLHREPVEQIEFHCALVAMNAFEKLGPLDEGLLSAAEHTDLCLMAREAGGSVYMEPNSVVTYVPPPPFTPEDLEYFRLRWSHAWNEASIERFRAKWNLADDDPSLDEMRRWLTNHRRIALAPYTRYLRMFGRKPARFVEKVLLGPIEESSNRKRFPYGQTGGRVPLTA